MTELDGIKDLLDATRTELFDMFDRVVENSGGLVIKPGSPALAVFYAYEEIVERLWMHLQHDRAVIGAMAEHGARWLHQTSTTPQVEEP